MPEKQRNGTNYIELRHQVINEIRKDWDHNQKLEEPERGEAAKKLFDKYTAKYGTQFNSKTIKRYVKDITGVLVYW